MIALKILAGAEAIIIAVLCITLLATLFKRRNEPEQHEPLSLENMLDKPIGDGPKSKIDKRV